MKYLFLICALCVACDKKSDNGGSANPSADPFYGKWQYTNPNSTSSQIKGMGAILGTDGSVIMMNMYITPGSASAATMVFRKSIGTFTRNGDLVTLKYSYETCDPVGTETLKAKVDPQNSDRLVISNLDGSVFLSMSRISEAKNDLSISGVEDKNCNILALLQKQSRAPASIKSVLDFLK